MKTKLLIIVNFLISFYINAQLINTIKVPSSTNPSLYQAREEFYEYYNNHCWLTANAYALELLMNLQNISCPPTSWQQPMLTWNYFETPLGHWPKRAAAMVIAYAKAYRYESDANRKSLYEDKARKGAEFLFWLKYASGNNGGFPDSIANGSIPPGRGVFTTGIVGEAFYECYLSLGDQKFKDALIQTAEWQLVNPSYPHSFPDNPKKYYSNVNHHSWPLKNLSLAYRISGDQRYLDRAIQIAEEIIAWQDYRDTGIDWYGNVKDPWGSTAIPDGSWYWYDYGASGTLPPGVDTPPEDPRGSLSAERKIDYHVMTMDGLLEILSCTTQQVLPGTTTIRNNQTFTSFLDNLRNSIIKGINYMINYQETINDIQLKRYRGLIISYKNYRAFGGDNIEDFERDYTLSAPHGISPIINGYISLLKSNKLSESDINKLSSFLNGVSINSLYKYDFGWDANVWKPVMSNHWADYMKYKCNEPYSSNLNLVNSSFEDKNIVWELWSWDGSGVNISNSYKKNGLNSARILDNNTNASKWASLLVSATPGVTYKAQVYARILNGRQSLYIHYYDQNYNLIDYGYSHIYANSDFQLVSLQRVAPSNTKYLRITLYADWYMTSEGFWDDVSLTTVLAKESQTISEQIIPTTLLLENYPNPFNPSTTIYFELPERSNVTIKIYDVIGNEISTVINQVKEAGKYKIDFNGEGLPSGVYFCTLQTKTELIKRKMLLLK